MKPWFPLEPVARPDSRNHIPHVRGASFSSMTKKLLLCSVIFTAMCGGTTANAQQPPTPASLHAEGNEPLQMIVNYADGTPAKRRESRHGVVDPVGLPIGQAASITLKFLRKHAGRQVSIGSLDGGVIDIQPPLTIAADGSLSFRFTPGTSRGLYRLQVFGTEPYELQLYAFDPNAPAKSRRR